MSKVIIFGVQDFAELAHFYLELDTEHHVVGFTVHEKYLNLFEFKGLPVTPFETIQDLYPPSDYKLFAPLSPLRMNSLRETVYKEGKSKGYDFISYISSKATYYGTPVGENCFIFENNVIQPFTAIGNNTILWSGNHLGHHSLIKDHCFISSQVVISGHVTIENNCFLGVNSTIVDGINLAPNTYIGAGAMIGSDTKECGVYPAVKSELSKVPSNRLRGL